jgi:hypothetical protein
MFFMSGEIFMVKLCFVFMVVMLFTTMSAADTFRRVLTNVEKNMYVPSLELSSKEITPDCPQSWTINKYILHGGKQEGVEIIEVDTGKLRFRIVPTRGMSVLDVALADIRLGWDSPVKGLVHPHYVNLESRNGLGWLYGFNEWMVRGGLEFFGAPGPDEFVDNKGNKNTMNLTLHGLIGNQPASEVEILIEKEATYRIRIRGRVDEACLHGPKLEIWTEISTIPGSAEFQISDTITNHSTTEQEFGILYHGNYGPPILEKGAKFVTPAKQVTPINDHAATDVNRYDVYRAPTPGFAEQVYCLEMWADENDRTKVMLQNAAGDKAIAFAYSVKELPYFTQWKNPVALEDGYVTGLEPGTGYPRNRGVERPHGRVPKLAPHENRSFTMDFTILKGKEQVSAVHKEIQAIQGGRETKMSEEPLP